MPNPRNLNYVLGSVGQSLIGLSQQWSEAIPDIQLLVVNKQTGLPGDGIGWFMNRGENPAGQKQDGFVTDLDYFRKLSKKQLRELVNSRLQQVYTYPKWPLVLAAFGLEPTHHEYAPIIKAAKTGSGGGESHDHSALKAFVAKHPETLGLPRFCAPGQIECALPSGDSMDVCFQHGDETISVEVKSAISQIGDIARGLFQCIKYRAVIEAKQATLAQPQSARAVLVLESILPRELIAMKNILGVEVIENIKPIS